MRIGALLLLVGLGFAAYQAHRRFDHRLGSESEVPAAVGKLDLIFAELLQSGVSGADEARRAIKAAVSPAEAERLGEGLPTADQPWRRQFDELTSPAGAPPITLPEGARILAPKGRFAHGAPPLFVSGLAADGQAHLEFRLQGNPAAVAIEATFSGSQSQPLPETLDLTPGSAWEVELIDPETRVVLDQTRFELLSEAELEAERAIVAILKRHVLSVRLRYVAQAMYALASGLDTEASMLLTRLDPQPQGQPEPLITAMQAVLAHRQGFQPLRDALLARVIRETVPGDR